MTSTAGRSVRATGVPGTSEGVAKALSTGVAGPVELEALFFFLPSFDFAILLDYGVTNESMSRGLKLPVKEA